MSKIEIPIPSGPLWRIGNVYYRDGIEGGALLVGMVAIDPETGPIGWRAASDERLQRISVFARWDDETCGRTFADDVRSYMSHLAHEDMETWNHRAAGTGNAMSYLYRGSLRACLAGGNRMAFVEHCLECAEPEPQP